MMRGSVGPILVWGAVDNYRRGFICEINTSKSPPGMFFHFFPDLTHIHEITLRFDDGPIYTKAIRSAQGGSWAFDDSLNVIWFAQQLEQWPSTLLVRLSGRGIKLRLDGLEECITEVMCRVAASSE